MPTAMTATAMATAVDGLAELTMPEAKSAAITSAALRTATAERVYSVRARGWATGRAGMRRRPTR